MKEKLLNILSLLSGILMILAGIYAVFNGGAAVGTFSWIIGLAALIAGIVSVLFRIMITQNSALIGGLLSADGVILIIVGLLLMNTSILRGLGKLLFIGIGIILIFNAVQSLMGAFSSKKNSDGWFIPRIIFCVLLLLVGIWVFTNAGKAFDETAGLIIGVYFISHGATSISDWIGRRRYNRNFGYLD